MNRNHLSVFACAVLGLVSAESAFAMAPPRPDFGDFSVAPQVRELSGAVWDARNRAIWSHGDSGTGLIIGRTSTDSWTTIRIHVKDPYGLGVRNRDWEAMVQDRRGQIWLLDVGDNGRVRDHVMLYRIDPRFLSVRKVVKGSRLYPRKNRTILIHEVPVLEALRVEYPDGARDVEGAVVRGDRIYLFEKTSEAAARIASVDIAPGHSTDQLARLEGVLSGTVPGGITDAVLDASGRVQLLSYSGLYECKGCFGGASRRLALRKPFFLGQVETLINRPDGGLSVGGEDGRFSGL